jgi:hypothetical protein
MSPDSKLVYRVIEPWGRLTFMFRMRAPDVLCGVAFHPGVMS